MIAAGLANVPPDVLFPIVPKMLGSCTWQPSIAEIKEFASNETNCGGMKWSRRTYILEAIDKRLTLQRMIANGEVIPLHLRDPDYGRPYANHSERKVSRGIGTL